MTVNEIMQTDLLCCSPETTVHEAARLMSERGVGACVVVSGQGLEGMFTERDVVRAVASGGDVRSLGGRNDVSAGGRGASRRRPVVGRGYDAPPRHPSSASC